MTKSTRGRYTLEFKQEAARLVESGQSQAAAARSLGVVEQTLGNWVRKHRAGTLKGASSKPVVSAEQMENSRLRAELAGHVPYERPATTTRVRLAYRAHGSRQNSSLLAEFPLDGWHPRRVVAFFVG